MIAYNKEKLRNLEIQEDAATACRLKAITAAEKTAINLAYPTGFYTPNIAMCIGLFLLTCVIVSAGQGLLALLLFTSDSGGEGVIRGMLLIYGFMTYAGMELFITKGHYHSGVDDALLWLSSGLILAGLTPFEHNTEIACCMIAFVIGVLATLRTANGLMAVVSFLALLGAIFFRVHGDQPGNNRAIPFTWMLLSALVYLVARALQHKPALRNYKTVFPWLLTASLLTFYAAGNYFVAAEVTADPYTNALIPHAALYWTFTAAIPLVYLFTGIRLKDAILLRTGLGLVAAAILTIRTYYHVLPTEWVLVLAGAALVFIAYMLIRYLRTPKRGFSDEPAVDASRFTKLQLESLIITQTMHAPAAPQGVDFGGGSGGGGGAGGTF